MRQRTHPSMRIVDGQEVWFPEHSHVHQTPGADPEENSHYINPRTIRFPHDEFVDDEAVTLDDMRKAGAI